MNKKLRDLYCPGCGLHELVHVVNVLFKTMKQPPAVVSGLGCAGRIVNYIKTDTYHTLHGRAIPFALGLKLANPSRSICVISGDGDLSAIGGNHLIHSARRNDDLLVICVNNGVLGMTGGQSTATTSRGQKTTSAPLGNVEQPFDLCRLVKAAGGQAAEIIRQPNKGQNLKLLKKMVGMTGFRFLEWQSDCPKFARSSHPE